MDVSPRNLHRGPDLQNEVRLRVKVPGGGDDPRAGLDVKLVRERAADTGALFDAAEVAGRVLELDRAALEKEYAPLFAEFELRIHETPSPNVTRVAWVITIIATVLNVYGRIPAGSVVVSGNLPAADGSHSLYCAVIVKKVDAATRAKTSINELLRA